MVPIARQRAGARPNLTPSLPRVLLVDDDSVSRAVISECLEKGGYRVLHAGDGMSGIELAVEEKPALVILDWMMPRMTGIETAAEMRRLGFAGGILMLTSRNEARDRVHGLRIGADDYLAKPFNEEELLARVFALLRRTARHTIARTRLVFGSLIVDLDTQTARRAETPVAFSKTEYAMLTLLATRAGAVVSRDLMLDVVWGYTKLPTTRTVDTHIWRLRKKLQDDGDTPRWIHRIHGSGYMLALSAIEPPAECDATSRAHGSTSPVAEADICI